MDLDKFESFMELVGKLKHLKRTGWVIRDIPEPETIAGHMYRMAMIALLLDSNDKLDRTKVIEMTLLHDLAECIVGDITPHCGVPPEVKHQREDEAMETICDLLGDKGTRFLTLFREYEKQESPEAQYVKDLDRLDLVMQAYEYEKRENIPGVLQEFFNASTEKIRHPFVSQVAWAIQAKRDSFCKNAQEK